MKKKIALNSVRNNIETQMASIALQLRQGRQEFLFKKGIKPTSISQEIKALKSILKFTKSRTNVKLPFSLKALYRKRGCPGLATSRRLSGFRHSIKRLT
ncbi:MAG TPA: hypothetical protein VJ184_10655 [Chryseolinea sp.]|nr:hypothetical protein [Chryseolinea sp.]